MNRIPRELVDSIIQYLHLILQNQSTDGVGKRKLSSFSSVSRTFQASIEGITFHHLSAEAKDLEFLDKILNTRRRALVHSFSFKIKLYESDIRHNKRKLSGLLDLIHSLGHFGRHEPLLTADLFCMDEENPDYSGSWPNLKKLDIEFSMASQLFSLSDFLSGTKTPPVPAKEERYFSRLILGILEAIPRMPKIEEIRIVICGYRRDGAWGDVHSPLCFAFSPSKWRRLKEGAADCTLGGTSLGEKIESGGFLTQTEICPLPWDIPNDGPVPPMPLFLLDEDGSVDRYATPKPWCPSRIAVQRWEEIWDAL
ncbi:hypothetical protein QBC47DRAFT_413117 [Echria macrotheca]|uniref:Uncharacterized protein n=1 Tax=Echria macrotheca TaxID=438768 RepID=A0AAJ0BE33_9PEZI|nr:hypothetical protein QBC47DRAFT_413117 [Echria macrotheca]